MLVAIIFNGVEFFEVRVWCLGVVQITGADINVVGAISSMKD